MKIIKKEIQVKDDTFTGPIADLVAVRAENGRMYAYFEVDEHLTDTKVSIKFVQAGKEYPITDFVGYTHFDIVNLYDNSMFGSSIFGWGGEDYEYHIYVNIERNGPSHLFDELFQTPQQKEKNDPAPEGAELFVKAQIAKGNEATFTAKNCLIDQDILNKLI